MRPYMALVLTTVLAAVVPGRVAAQCSERHPSAWIAEFPSYETLTASWLQTGFASKRADRCLREEAPGLETLRALVAASREDDALKIARQVFEAEPARVADVLTEFSKHVPRAGELPGREVRVLAMLEHARTRIAALPPADRAPAAYALAKAEVALVRGSASIGERYPARWRAIADEYPGTPTALHIAVDLLEQDFYATPVAVQQQEQLLRFAREHAGTEAGARALYLAAFHVANNATMLNLASEEDGADPTDRLLQVFDLVSELTSGRYPPSEWTQKGPSLIGSMSAFKPVYSPANALKLLSAYGKFVAKHWRLDDQADPSAWGVGYLVTARMAELFKVTGDPTEGVERFLQELESKVPDPFAARYLRANYYLKAASETQDASVKAERLARAARLLNSIHQQGDGLYKRKALATIASRAFFDRQWEKAHRAFREYAAEFPDSPYRWIAMLRAGQCREEMADWRGAAAAYGEVAARGDEASLASVVRDVFGGRAFEALGEFERARRLFRQAADGWDRAFGPSFSLSSPHASRPGDSFPLPRDARWQVELTELQARAAELARTLAAPGGNELERARWLLETKQWQEAAGAAARIEFQFKGSPNAPVARYLNHRARLEEALALADVEKVGADSSRAADLIDRLAAEPFDFAVGVASIARAYLASAGGATAAGEKQLLQSLARMHNAQPPAATRLSSLEQDVAAIRSLVFRPNGDGIYAGSRWNGFAWPQPPPPFVVTSPEVRVTLANGQVQQLSFVQRFPDLGGVLFVDRRQLTLLDTLITRLGGNKTREGRIFWDKGVVEAPIQPVGPSLSVMAFLNKGLRVIPGHWGGWHFHTFPTISNIVFLDPERTRAVARVTVGYGGGDVLLEKQEGAWRATKLIQTWVT